MPAVTEELGRLLLKQRAFLAVAESCTGGLIAKLVTDIPGSSAWFERGLVTYSNRAKQDLLGVPPEILEQFGAVSRECAEAMARGLLVMTPADWGVAVTGIAGPGGGCDGNIVTRTGAGRGGGSPEKPVGLVWMAWAQRGGSIESQYFQFSGSRDQVRAQAAEAALNGLVERLRKSG